MENDQGSNEVIEPTTDSPSEMSSTESNVSDVAESSREDTNTPDTPQEETEEAVKEKGQARFQKLANEKRELSRREQLSQPQQSEQYTYPQQGYQQPYVDPIQAKVYIQDQELQRIREEQELDKAARKHPELDESSKDYDPEFHDRVWAIRNAEGMTYAEAAERLKDLTERYSQRAVEKETNSIEEKQSGSVNTAKRQPVSTDTRAEQVQFHRERFKKTGSWEDLQKIRELETDF